MPGTVRKRRRRTSAHNNDLIASVAARLLVEGEALDFATAKHKANLQLGGHDERLPANHTIHAAMITYQRIFDGPATRARVVDRRRKALLAMALLRDFEPRLTGPVLYGSALEHNAVTLHLFTDEAEHLLRFLIEHGIPYKIDTKQLRTSRQAEVEFTVAWISRWDLDFELVAMPRIYLQHPPLSPLDGDPYRHCDYERLDALLAHGSGGDVYPDFSDAVADPARGCFE